MAAKTQQELRASILELVREYYSVAHQDKRFVPGKSRVNYSGRVYDHEEMTNLADAALDFWLTLGPYGERARSHNAGIFRVA